ncbi:hypothetical protein [Amycolatopsis magusensis]|uniref:hypothetical protein n=1 Tax=Amycolatopsis magusensis TaxID=882444 RepID=UPI0037B57F80
MSTGSAVSSFAEAEPCPRMVAHALLGTVCGQSFLPPLGELADRVAELARLGGRGVGCFEEGGQPRGDPDLASAEPAHGRRR